MKTQTKTAERAKKKSTLRFFAITLVITILCGMFPFTISAATTPTKTPHNISYPEGVEGFQGPEGAFFGDTVKISFNPTNAEENNSIWLIKVVGDDSGTVYVADYYDEYKRNNGLRSAPAMDPEDLNTIVFTMADEDVSINISETKQTLYNPIPVYKGGEIPVVTDGFVYPGRKANFSVLPGNGEAVTSVKAECYLYNDPENPSIENAEMCGELQCYLMNGNDFCFTASLSCDFILVTAEVGDRPEGNAEGLVTPDGLWTYNIDGVTATLTDYREGYNENITEMIVPTCIGDFPVAAIEDYTCSYSYYIQRVTFGARCTIPEIPDNCFLSCGDLVSVEIPESISIIDTYAFDNCKKLLYVTGMENVRDIGTYAFAHNPSLESISFPNATQLFSNVFAECSNLNEVTFENKNIRLDERAFYRCNSLRYIIYSGTVNEWEALENDNCFRGNSQNNIDVIVKATDGNIHYSCLGEKDPVKTKQYLTFVEGSGENGDNAFDLDKSTPWISELNNELEAFSGDFACIIFKADEPTDVTAYSITMPEFDDDISSDNCPTKWTLLGGNTYGVWEYLDSEEYSEAPITRGGQTVSFGVDVPGTYQYFVLCIEATAGESGTEPVCLSRIDVYGETYQVIVTADEGGTAYTDTPSVAPGQTVELTAVPDSNYMFKEWVVTTDNATIYDNSFVMPDGDVKVKATFARLYDITGDEGLLFYTYTENGEKKYVTQAPEDAKIYIEVGENYSPPEGCYVTREFAVNGESLGTYPMVSSPFSEDDISYVYDFIMPANSVNVTAMTKQRTAKVLDISDGEKHEIDSVTISQIMEFYGYSNGNSSSSGLRRGGFYNEETIDLDDSGEDDIKIFTELDLGGLDLRGVDNNSGRFRNALSNNIEVGKIDIINLRIVTYIQLLETADATGFIYIDPTSVYHAYAPLTLDLGPDGDFVNNCTLTATEATVGDEVSITCSAEGGYGEYEYCLATKTTSDTGWQSDGVYSEVESFDVTPTEPGVVAYAVFVRDAKGNISKKYLKLTTSALPLDNTSTVPESVSVGDDITINCSAEGGYGGYKYSVAVKSNSEPQWTVLSDGYSEETEYTISTENIETVCVRITVKDSYSRYNTVFKNVAVVAQPLENTSDVSGELKVNEELTIGLSAEGGYGDYEYLVSYKDAGMNEWCDLTEGYVTDESLSYTPEEYGSLCFRVIVRDNHSKYNTKYLNVVIAPTELVNNSTVTEDPVQNEEMTISLLAEGGYEDYTYLVSYKDTGMTEWTDITDGYISGDSVAFTPVNTGNHAFRITVKDSHSNYRTIYKVVKVAAEPEVEVLE